MKTNKKMIVIFIAAMLLTLCGCAAGDEAAQAGNEFISTAIIAVVDILAEGMAVLVLAAGAWVSKKLTDDLKLKSIGRATDELTRATVETVGELQQTLVDELKAKNGGKLSQNDVLELRDKAVKLTINKLSAPCKKILEASAVDVIAKIHGIAESTIGATKPED